MLTNVEESIAFTLRQNRIRPTENNKNLMFDKIISILPDMEMDIMDRQAYDSLESDACNEYYTAQAEAFDSLIKYFEE